MNFCEWTQTMNGQGAPSTIRCIKTQRTDERLNRSR